MRGLMAAIGRALRAIGRITWTVCKRTGRLVMSVIPDIGGSPGAGAPGHAVVEASAPDVSPGKSGALIASVKSLATALVRGDDFDVGDFKQVPTTVGDWLLAMDRSMLCRVIAAADDDLRAQLIGNGSLRGVIACNRDAIDAYVVAMSRPDPDPNRPAHRRTYYAAYA